MRTQVIIRILALCALATAEPLKIRYGIDHLRQVLNNVDSDLFGWLSHVDYNDLTHEGVEYKNVFMGLSHESNNFHFSLEPDLEGNALRLGIPGAHIKAHAQVGGEEVTVEGPVEDIYVSIKGLEKNSENPVALKFANIAFKISPAAKASNEQHKAAIIALIEENFFSKRTLEYIGYGVIEGGRFNDYLPLTLFMANAFVGSQI